MHYYKRHLGDYAKKAGRLSMLQHGSYTLLLDACYDRERFPTMDEAIEWTWASTAEEIEAVQFVLRKFFVLDGGVYVQSHIQEVIADYHLKAETNKRIAIERETNRKGNSTKRVPDVNEPPPNHKPLTTNQEPQTINHKPRTKNQEPTEQVKPPAAAKAASPLNASIWLNYSTAYFNKYGTEPVRNAKVNSQVSQLGQRLGDDAAHVAGWFLTHKNGWYSQKMHSVDCLLSDAEKLRTEWATGTQMTQARARQVDKSTGGGNVFLKLMDEGFAP